jgi:hypothetical protein
MFPEAKTPEAQKEKVREHILQQRAMADASEKANEFAHSLIDNPSSKPDAFESAARTNGYTVAVSAPFDRSTGPEHLDVGPEFSKAAFALSQDEPFAGPIPGEDGAYVIALNKRIPHEIPPLDKIRNEVVNDYKRSQAIQLARQAGTAFYQTLTNKLSQGLAFTNICAESHITPVALPPFSLSTRELPEAENFVSLNQLKQAAFSTAPGKVSQFDPTSDGGLILFVQAKLPIDPAKMDSEMPRFLSSLRSTRQSEAFNDWLNREAQKGLRDTPVGRPKPAPSMGSSGTAKS